MNVPVALVTAWLALAVSPAQADLPAQIASVRAQGCGRNPGVTPALTRVAGLDRAARLLADGRSLRDAMSDAGYRAVEARTLEVTGKGPAAIARTLSRQGCEDILNPAYREMGIFERENAAWIVLAAPFAPPAAAQRSSVGQELLARVNEARARPRRCGWKRFGTAAPLAYSSALERAAIAHARDMLQRGRLSHGGSDGSSAADRATRAGYAWRVVAENIASGQPTAERVLAEWLTSPGHCANVMDPDFTEMGVAFAADSAGIYWVQLFGAPKR